MKTLDLRTEAKIKRDAIETVSSYTNIPVEELVADYQDIPQCPEKYLYIHHTKCSAQICWNYDRNTGTTIIDVEYPSSKDGEFVSFKNTSVENACKVFEFAVNILQDIRGQLDQIG